MVQEKSSARFKQGVPAGLSIGKSADLWKPKAVQQSAKQLAQFARRVERSSVVVSEESVDVMGERSFWSDFERGPGCRGTPQGASLPGIRNDRPS